MITDSLKIALADHIESALIVHGYHWNIEGADFNQYHDFFGCIYDDYQAQVDLLAEYIRIVSFGNEYVAATTSIVKLNTTVKAVPVVGNKPIQMCAEIVKINNILFDRIAKLFDEATDEKMDGLANYCADRMNAYTKLNWKLLAIAK